MKRLSLIKTFNEVELYVYTPSLFQPLLKNLEKMSLKRRLRYFRNYCRKGKYLVYYLKKGEQFIAMCVACNGGGGLKLKCTSQEDIVLGPYYVIPSERGKGYAKMLIGMVLENYPTEYRYAFDLISKKNTPSLKASQAMGFEVYEEIKLVGLLRRHKVVENNGTYYILQTTNKRDGSI